MPPQHPERPFQTALEVGNNEEKPRLLWKAVTSGQRRPALREACASCWAVSVSQEGQVAGHLGELRAAPALSVELSGCSRMFGAERGVY